jgi:hypothetical protein
MCFLPPDVTISKEPVRLRLRRKLVTLRMLARILSLSILAVVPPSILAGPITLGDWHQFSFTTAGSPAAGCDPADPAGGFCIPSSGTPALALDTPPWTFTAPVVGVILTVTDSFLSGDRFEVFDFGASLGLTSLPQAGFDCGDDPVPCLATPGISSGKFLLPAGVHSITIVPILSPDGGGSGFLLAQTVPEPGSITLLGFGIAAVWFNYRIKTRSGLNRRGN